MSAITNSDLVPPNRFAGKTLQDYEVISVIGSGSFGTCFKVRDKETGELYAWKGIDYDELSETKKESLVSEINVLSQLNHPNIVQYYHHLVNYEAKSIFIVMECCKGGDLAQLIGKARATKKHFEERYIWRVLFQICKALQVCHNKISTGTILHRDIKPANIFLDENGNSKLGDFGLARMLRRYESFAESFVGTPHYMSPEIVKGTKYDRKSDVWAVGCLIYEMCALRPPFQGKEFEQLSANISNGKFTSIPSMYSKDLQEMITFMLEVKNADRPSIEIVTRHPVVIRNITNLGNEFPQLINGTTNDSKCYDTNWTDLSSTILTEDQRSFNEAYGQRRLSFSGVFTPDLRAELFQSAKRKIFSKFYGGALQLSDPELYESIRHETENATPNTNVPSSHTATDATKQSPSAITQNIFDKALLERLHAIRERESLLNVRAANLDVREQLLNEREKRVHNLEQTLQNEIEKFERSSKKKSAAFHMEDNKNLTAIQERFCLPHFPKSSLTQESTTMPPPPPPPPIPPRKVPPKSQHDDTYCTIEPNDTIFQEPTVAKLDLAALPAVRAFPTIRKVTFQSPKKFIKYDIENILPSSLPLNNHRNTQMQATSISSKTSDESAEGTTTQRRKSILSIFGLSRSGNSKEHNTTTTTSTSTVRASKTVPTIKNEIRPLTTAPKTVDVLAKCETAELANIWTKEHKRAAFDLLAAMNASKGKNEDNRRYLQSQPQAQATRQRLRLSMRDRNSLQRNQRMRRSVTIAPQTFKTAGDRIIV